MSFRIVLSLFLSVAIPVFSVGQDWSVIAAPSTWRISRRVGSSESAHRSVPESALLSCSRITSPTIRSRAPTARRAACHCGCGPAHRLSGFEGRRPQAGSVVSFASHEALPSRSSQSPDRRVSGRIRTAGSLERHQLGQASTTPRGTTLQALQAASPHGPSTHHAIKRLCHSNPKK